MSETIRTPDEKIGARTAKIEIGIPGERIQIIMNQLFYVRAVDLVTRMTNKTKR